LYIRLRDHTDIPRLREKTYGYACADSVTNTQYDDGKHRVFVAEPDEKILAYDQEANKIEIQIPEEIANKLRKV